MAVEVSTDVISVWNLVIAVASAAGGALVAVVTKFQRSEKATAILEQKIHGNETLVKELHTRLNEIDKHGTVSNQLLATSVENKLNQHEKEIRRLEESMAEALSKIDKGNNSRESIMTALAVEKIKRLQLEADVDRLWWRLEGTSHRRTPGGEEVG